MKKRLLITSIVMMLVVAVALSTATYAWFTSNANVTASTISLTAATNDADALGIGWASGEAGTSIASNISDVLAPMAPLELVDGQTTIGATTTQTHNISFFTQTTKTEGSVYVFNAAGESATPIRYGNGSDNAFYVKNLSSANTIAKITVSAVFDGDASLYTPIMTKTIAANETYYTKSGNIYTAVKVGEQAINNTNFTAASGTAVEGIDYYALNDTTYTKVTTTLTVGETSVVGYYTLVTENIKYTVTNSSVASRSDHDANDMIRVAIFKKSNSNGANTNDDGYTLLGVLGQTETTYKQVTENTDSANNEEYNKNKTYYTKSGEVYTQVSINAFAASTTYYTAENTAVYGEITANGAVKNLQHHKVSEELTLTTNLLAGYQVDIVALIWLDGTALDDTRQGDVGNVSLLFSAS